MSQDHWVDLTIVSAMAAAFLAVVASRKRSVLVRVAFAALAATITVGVMGDLGPILRFLDRASAEDSEWRQIRRSLSERSPAFGDIITLNPAIEKEFQVAIVPIVRDRDRNEVVRGRAMAAAIRDVFAKHVYPVAAHGSTGAVISWGHLKMLLLQRFAVISIEACALYGTRSIARLGSDEKAAALGQGIYRAVIDAYKTSDDSKYPLPDREGYVTQYVKAIRSAQPPFNDEEIWALDDLEKHSPQRQCNLTLRLYKAIDDLDPASKQSIYRIMMRTI